MIKRLIVICIAIIGSTAYAQQGTASPYSFYGIGTLKFKGTVENRSMGGLSVYLDSIHVNLKNPAAYVGKNIEGYPFDNESRPVKFSIAGTSSSLNLESASQSQNTSVSSFDYLAISVPIGKFGFGFGLLPYTSVGYKQEDINEAEDNRLENRYRGEGGLNRVFAGLGYKISDKLSIGVDVNYNFGNVKNTAIAVAYTPEGDVVQYQTRQNTRSDLSGLNLNFGLAYKSMLTEQLELSATATFSPENSLVSKNQRSYSTVTINTINEEELVFNTINEDLGALEQTDLVLPSRLTFGAGIGAPRSWFVGAEYTMQNTSKFHNPIFNTNNSTFENASQISVGGFYIPNYNAFSGYFKRVVYRAGFNFGNTGLVIKNESIKEFGMSFGLGLPVGNRSLFSNANLGVELGQRGTTNQNLVKENFVNFNISLSLNSRWFQKRKYN